MYEQPLTETSPATAGRSRTKRSAIALAGVALMGIGGLAIANSASATAAPENEPAIQKWQASDTRPDCGYSLKLLAGDDAQAAAGALAANADDTLRYDGVDIIFTSDQNDATAGAMIDESVYLTITADQSRIDELTNVVKEAIDHEDEDFDDTVQLTAEYRGVNCDLNTVLLNESFEDEFFNGETTVAFDHDDGECEFNSGFGDDGFSFDDFSFSDLDIDFSHGDEGFSLELNHRNDTVTFGCTHDQ